jgi:transcriptional regulator with PAS, ATPase and Fis domain
VGNNFDARAGFAITIPKKTEFKSIVPLSEEIDKASMFEEIVGTSRSLQTALLLISKVAPTGSSLLVTGETGTGN